MSPSMHFPSPFRGSNLPPYGHADWKQLQPALLRRSLAISSSLALLAGLLLGLVLQKSADRDPGDHVFHPEVWTSPKDPPPLPPDPGPRQPAVVHDPKDGNILEADTTLEVIIKEPEPPGQPAWPTPGTGGTGRVPEGPGGGWTDTFPDRPNPGDFVVVDELPFPVYSPKPEYPELARQAGIEGTVTIKVLVDRQGRVVELIHVTSSPIFDDAAEKALRTWRFRPALVGNHPVPAWVAVPVRFVMH